MLSMPRSWTPDSAISSRASPTDIWAKRSPPVTSSGSGGASGVPRRSASSTTEPSGDAHDLAALQEGVLAGDERGVIRDGRVDGGGQGLLLRGRRGERERGHGGKREGKGRGGAGEGKARGGYGCVPVHQPPFGRSAVTAVHGTPAALPAGPGPANASTLQQTEAPSATRRRRSTPAPPRHAAPTALPHL